MRTFPAMITISIGLGLNQLRLHRGENGLALGHAQPNGLGGHHICRPVAGDHFASLNAPGCFRQLQQNPPLHAISPVNLDQNSIAPPTLRRSQVHFRVLTPRCGHRTICSKSYAKQNPEGFHTFSQTDVWHDFRNHTVSGSFPLHKRHSKFPSKAIIIRIAC